MKKLLTMLVLTLCMAMAVQAQKQPAAKTDGIETRGLDEVVQEVNIGIGLAREDLKANGLEISTAEVTLKTIRSTDAGGGFKIFVKASKKWQLEKASSVKYSYAKMESLVAMDSTKGKEKLHEALRKAISASAAQWKRASSAIQGLEKNSFTIEISFGVTKSTSGGVEFEVWGVGLDLEGSKELTASHSISLTFKSETR
ncbi:MAG: hypothetical protein IPL81_10110 [Flavobacteriales bacterium]|nr:hypothetical protein [Flavobacteriales bacterium]MBK9060198.1 hypothetical protein [Flavobacteriales bacterium]QQS71742.1 MAG: hypothetical protein IPP95_11170 [Flavobacteriales bacterium]HQV38932.1 hypothetical protein [Flavobacteriales bacterium]HQW32422.1 hypothetical protein [Flavobacteriales bacterium]